MLQVKPFNQNIFFSYVREFFNIYYYRCSLCNNFVYNGNKYDIVADSNNIKACVIDISLKYDGGVYFLFYCLHCETLFDPSHRCEFTCIEPYFNLRIISKFEYENNVVIGTPYFDSFFSFEKEIQDKKFNNIILTCACRFPECPAMLGGLKNVTINNISSVFTKNSLCLIPKNTKSALYLR